MESKIISAIEGDLSIQKLLKEFEEEFENSYKRLKEKEKDNVLFVKDSIVRIWMYSALTTETYLNPNYLINQLAQEKVKGDYAVSPHIRINTNQEKKLEFKREYIYYSIEKHPVLQDLDKLVNFADPTIIVRDENDYIIDNGEIFIEDISFRSSYYVDYLLDLAESLGILAQMKSIGCTCFVIGDSYDSFKALDNNKKLIKIIQSSIDYSVRRLNGAEIFLETFTEKQILSYLDNDINFGDYIKNIKTLENEIHYMVRTQLPQESKENVDGIAAVSAQLYYKIFMDMYFTSIYGYYLGIITPNNGLMFIMKKFIKEVADEKETNDTLRLIFQCDDIHDLTPFGKKILGELKNSFNDNFYMTLKVEDFPQIMDLVKRENDAAKEAHSIDYAYEEENYDDGNQEFIQKHLEKFYKYLINDKGLKDTTAGSHYENVDLFLSLYLKCEDIKAIKNISADQIDFYMRGYYIENIATSKTDTKNQLVSMGKYGEFLYAKKFISEDELKNIKKLVKNKDLYIKLYEDQFNQWV